MSGWRVLRIVPPLAVGVAIAAFLISGKEPPERVAQQIRHVAARTQIVAPQPVAPEVRGYGNVRPARSWAAVAEVAGTVIWRHPDLDPGNVIKAGEKVLEIDPADYELALVQIRADLDALQAEDGQLDVEQANTARILELERERLALAESDLNRVRGLAQQGATPQARVDEQERATLQVRRVEAELANTLALIPSRKARITAQIARAEAALARAKRDLEKTRIRTPFDIRVGQVTIERHQFAGIGQPLVEGDGIAAAEVTAQIPIDAFPRLIGGAHTGGFSGVGDLRTAFATISAEVRLVSARGQVWPARLVRVENALDPQARSVPVVVRVDDPYAGANPPMHLPLVPNMYVEVTLRAPATAARIAVPDSAVHEGDTVYLRDAAGLLELRKIAVAYRQDDMAVLDSGLAPGEEIILDDLIPAIPGTPVDPVATVKGQP